MKTQKALSAAALLTLALTLAPPAAADPVWRDPIGELWAAFLQAVAPADSSDLDAGPRMDDNGFQGAACGDYTACIDPNGLRPVERQGSACDPNGTTRCPSGDDGSGIERAGARIDDNGFEACGDYSACLDPNGG